MRKIEIMSAILLAALAIVCILAAAYAELDWQRIGFGALAAMSAYSVRALEEK